MKKIMFFIIVFFFLINDLYLQARDAYVGIYHVYDTALILRIDVNPEIYPGSIIVNMEEHIDKYKATSHYDTVGYYGLQPGTEYYFSLWEENVKIFETSLQTLEAGFQMITGTPFIMKSTKEVAVGERFQIIIRVPYETNNNEMQVYLWLNNNEKIEFGKENKDFFLRIVLTETIIGQVNKNGLMGYIYMQGTKVPAKMLFEPLMVQVLTNLDAVKETPVIFGLEQNYPNPFNPQTVINYSIPKTSYVKLSVYNVYGQEVVVLADEIKSIGNYQVVFNAVDMSSGIYFCKLQTDSFSQIHKMSLVK